MEGDQKKITSLIRGDHKLVLKIGDQSKKSKSRKQKKVQSLWCFKHTKKGPHSNRAWRNKQMQFLCATCTVNVLHVQSNILLNW